MVLAAADITRSSGDGWSISSPTAPLKPRLFSTRLLRRMWRPTDIRQRKPLPNGSPKIRERPAGCTGHKTGDALEQAKKGVEPYAGWLKQGEGAVVPVSRYNRRGGGVARNTVLHGIERQQRIHDFNRYCRHRRRNEYLLVRRRFRLCGQRFRGSMEIGGEIA